MTLGVLVSLAGALVVALLLLARSRHHLILTALSGRLERSRELIALDLLDEPTHGRLSSAADVLTVARDRLLAVGGQPDRDLPAITAALAVVEDLERAIRETAHLRRPRQRRPRLAPIGGLAAENDYHPDEDPLRLYQDPQNLPDWIRGARFRAAVSRVGAVLDDVRLLHDASIEATVLVLMLWVRLSLLATAPLLTEVSFGQVPLTGGLEAHDLAWLAALATAAATALAAPRITHRVMSRDPAGARTRWWLSAVEMPIAVAAMIATPCWPVAAFAAGWLNWWQRLGVHVRRGLVWLAAVVVSLSVGMVLAGAAAANIAAEIGISLTAIALIGGSYGAMLPMTVATLLSVVVGGALVPRRAKRVADEHLRLATRQLLDAACVIEVTAPAGDSHAVVDAANLRDIAAALAAGADTDRAARRVPLTLDELLADALARGGGPRYEPLTAACSIDAVVRQGHVESLTVLPASFYEDRLAWLRFKRRPHAQALSQLIAEIVAEASRYGPGPLSARCQASEGRLVLRFANAIRDEPVPSGRGSGHERLEALTARIPDGRLEQRGVVDGSFVDLPAAARRFGVELSIPLTLFDPVGKHNAAA